MPLKSKYKNNNAVGDDVMFDLKFLCKSMVFTVIIYLKQKKKRRKKYILLLLLK